MIKHVTHDGGRKAAGFYGDTGDCVCRAIAITTGLPYADVYARLAEGNATQRRSKHTTKAARKRSVRHGVYTKRKWFRDYMTELGFVWVPTMEVGQGCRVHLKADELPAGRIVVRVSNHLAAVIDGVLYDTHDCSRGETRCVYGYWELPKSHSLPPFPEKMHG